VIKGCFCSDELWRNKTKTLMT